MLKRFSFIFISVVLSLQAFSQNWIIYNTQNSGLPANEVLCVTQDQQYNKWIGTYWGGVARFNNTQWTVYTDTNSAMPHYTIRAVAVDGNNVKWFGTPKGVAKFDDINWTVYDTSNSPIPSDFINVIKVDNDNNKWIGTNKGLAKFDGQNWTTYTTSNSQIPSNYIQSLEIDGSGNLWLGTYGGLVNYDVNDNIWNTYNSANAPLEDNTVFAIGITGNDNVWLRTYSQVLNFQNNDWDVYDQFTLGLPNSFSRSIVETDTNNIWIAGDEGLVKLHYNNDTIEEAEYFNSFNSGLPNNGITTLFVDHANNLWSGVSLGNLAVYNPGGVDLTAIAEQLLVADFSFYPNPSTDYSNLDFNITENESILFEAFDMAGRKVLPDVMKRFPSGANRYSFQTSALNTGIYFLKLSAGERSSVVKFIVNR